MPLVAGSRVDSYEVVAPLGAGGMGEVYRARDTTLKRDVAIKVLPAYWSRDPQRLRRFELEAQAAAALNHPNIVSIFHVGEYEDSPYIVTELLHGETLRERLRKGPMRLREALGYGVEIARGLGAAHDAGVIHRDLKPENIFVTTDGRLKILDFGLAKLQPVKAASANGSTLTLQEQTSPGHVLGTVGYMSPEQVRGRAADARSDIFAAGAVLYEMLTGKRAFQKATSAETMSAILNEDPPPVSQIAPSLPPELQRIVNRCVAKSPEQRFQHAADLAFALEALSDSSSAGIAAVKEQASSKRWRWIAGTLASITIAAAAFTWWKVPPAVPIVEAVTQLTDDGEPKPFFTKVVTDGSRVYFNEGTIISLQIAQVAATGGPTALIPTRLANPQISGLAPAGSALLAIGAGFGNAGPLWQIPLPAGEARRLGTIEANDAEFLPDGHIIFAQGADLYLAERDGSNARRLVSVDGHVGEPSFSPDGQRLVFTLYSHSSIAVSIVEARADGSALHSIVNTSAGGRVCCAQWTPDGRYIVFQKEHEGRRDLWVFPMKAGFFQRSHQPLQLTNGPLSYTDPVVSRDGKQIFAIGAKPRGELVRYDVNSNQFLPLLSGISAFNPTFSKEGKWVAYTAYPDHTLWRSRADGTDRLQLTYPPVQVSCSFISPDGKRVAYGNSEGEIYVISMEGDPPQEIAEKNSFCANWSPDGNFLVFTDYDDAAHNRLQMLDLRTGKRAVVPGSQDLAGGQWVTEDMLVAAPLNLTKLLAFDVKTQRWSDLVSGTMPGAVVNWAHSLDYKSVYYTTGGTEPKAMRIRLTDHKVETITSLKDLPRATGPEGHTQISVGPDGSAVFTRDIGTQEIYALTVKWP